MIDLTETRLGIALIVEGKTDKLFYKQVIAHYVAISGCALHEEIDGDSLEEIFYVLDAQKNCRAVIKFHDAGGAITQVQKAGRWFEKKCMESLKQLQWSVFLCYDTDDYKYEISKFQEGDWRRLRNKLNSIGTTRIAIYDMAAAADIEDVMLKGINSICAFLRCGAMTYEELSGAKGKVKMKKLFRKAGRYYHEGDRAGK